MASGERLGMGLGIFAVSAVAGLAVGGRVGERWGALIFDLSLLNVRHSEFLLLVSVVFCLILRPVPSLSQSLTKCYIFVH